MSYIHAAVKAEMVRTAAQIFSIPIDLQLSPTLLGFVFHCQLQPSTEIRFNRPPSCIQTMMATATPTVLLVLP